MAKRRKRTQKSVSELRGKLLPLLKSAAPHIILGIMSREYGTYMRKSRSDAEHEFWLKATRSSGNLASGMEKWLDEWMDEDDR